MTKLCKSKIAAILLTGSMACPWFVLAQSQIDISKDELTFEARGNYQGRLDRRDLLAIEHPIAKAQAGDYGLYRANVSIPADASPPYILSFYASDNNVPSGVFRGLMIDERKGHRFKQVRINGKIVWEADTFNAEVAEKQLVDITEFIGHDKQFRLEFGLVEKVDSSTKQEGDRIEINKKKAFQPKQENHQTQSYWGDFLILCGDAVPQKHITPWRPTVSEVSRPEALETWQASSIGIEYAELIPSGWTWPVVTGIPFPEGQYKGDAAIRLVHGPQEIPIRAMAYWPDGSLKWGLAQVSIKGGVTEKIGLAEGKAKEDEIRKCVIENKPSGSISTSTGQVKLIVESKEVGGFSIRNGEYPAITSSHFYLEGENSAFSAKWHPPTILENLPERTTVEAWADIISDKGERYGQGRVRITLFAGQPYIRMLSTIYNQNPSETFRAKRYGWKLTMPPGSKLETEESGFTASSENGSITGVVRYFRLLHPNAIIASPDEIDIRLFEAKQGDVQYYQTHPGEAKTHEIWFALAPTGAPSLPVSPLVQLVDRPPGLAISPLIRSSQVWGRMPPISPQEDALLYNRIIEENAEKYFSDVRTGLRPFGNYRGFESSFYWNTVHSMYALYAMTGERKWLDRAERSVRHMMDLLICHWSPDSQNVGGMYAYFSTKTKSGERAFEPDFSNADFNIRSQNPHAAFDHWQITGDPDGKRIGIGLADYIISSSEMNTLAKARSARHQGWALIALMRAYRETGDKRYINYARELIGVAKSNMEPRRGSYIQTHSSDTHPGIVPFMTGILVSGLREYHEATNDPEVLGMIATLLMATEEEMADRGWAKAQQGLSYYYSPNPYHQYSPTPHLGVGLVGGNAYLAAITGRNDFRDSALAGWKAYLSSPETKASMMIYDLPSTLFWIKQLKRGTADLQEKDQTLDSQAP